MGMVCPTAHPAATEEQDERLRRTHHEGRMVVGGFIGECSVCGEDAVDASYVMLVWRDADGRVQKRRYCASWVNEACWRAYERDATVVGFA